MDNGKNELSCDRCLLNYNILQGREAFNYAEYAQITMIGSECAV